MRQPNNEGEVMKAWHFLRKDRKLRYGDGRLVKTGQTLTVDCKPVLCESGLHASVRPMDALLRAAGPVICRVEVGGQVVEGEGEIVGTERHAIWMAKATNTLHLFACWCAEEALKSAKVEDDCCWNAIKTKHRWIQKDATDDELDAAWDAAWNSTWDASRAAAWAAARSAAWEYELDAARDAAWDAAWAIAWADRTAVRTSERIAIRDAAWEKQNAQLEAMREGLEGTQISWENEDG